MVHSTRRRARADLFALRDLAADLDQTPRAARFQFGIRSAAARLVTLLRHRCFFFPGASSPCFFSLGHPPIGTVNWWVSLEWGERWVSLESGCPWNGGKP